VAPATSSHILDELPETFLQRMRWLLGDEYEAFLRAYDTAPEVGLRVNTLKLSPQSFRALAPFDLSPIPWSESAFLVPEDAQPGKHPYHAAGLYYLQDPSALVPSQLLDPQPGERVLDLAAAPGGKATHIASLMRNEGLLVANEIHPKRVQVLAENLERWGVRNAVMVNETPDRLADRLEGFFDKVLVDAPCSGEGMFRKSAAARADWSLELVAGCARRQLAILDQAARLVRPGGLLVYCTCTFAPEENEGVVARFLRTHPEFELVEPPRRPGYAPGRPDWVADGESLPELRRTVRLWPHRGPGDGHFVALLARTGSGHPRTARLWQPHKVPGQARRLYETFCRESLTITPAQDRLSLVGAHLYQIPSGLPALQDLRVLRPGWLLGSITGNCFEPAHALAMSLAVDDVRRVIHLTADDPQVLAYLRGETLRVSGEDGWVMVAVDGYPLGWGKRVRGLVKNHYPRGLRWLNAHTPFWKVPGQGRSTHGV